jgi:hypothetical protein
MNELNRIEKELDDARVPREVWIGTDSTADRVTWLINRNRLNRRAASERFEKFGTEFGILATLKDEWLSVDEIHERLGFTIREDLKLALEYLWKRKLIDSCNDGLRGNLYCAVEPSTCNAKDNDAAPAHVLSSST